ncbi:cytosolic carboxypeptidase 1-like isoform X1 [Plodia interpunctella]|uniref:cytosolic carboxypeptidase 1-like isoform X1 n=3 Tax=Plodia interpunctella TaxID=58824 RepID=UPI0023682FC4|nr:cytosolic carboxypeptidase 1-like isoform X1 [Plodia interpunctella]
MSVIAATDSSAQTTEELKKPKKKSAYRMADESAVDCLFDRLRLHQQRAPDSVEVARAITARINARLTSHDKHVRQSTLDKLWNKQSGAIQMLLSILENSRDTATSTYITSILREALCLKQSKGKKTSVPIEASTNKKKENKKGKENIAPLVKKANNMARQLCAQHFIALNGSQTIIRVLVATHSKRDGNVSTELIVQDLVWILAALAPRDPKFAVKIRMLGCVRTMHLILKGHFTDNKLIFPLLVIVKQLAKNVVTTSILIRDGVIATYERVLASLGFIPTARLRLCLDAIDYFSKNKVCCMQIVKTGLCNVLLRVFDRWDRYEGRMRLKICAHILQTLQHLCNIKAGRRSLCTKKHVQTLHRFCSQCPDEPEFDGLLARVCSVITLCLKHQALPVPVSSPATFNLGPILKGTNASWPCHEDEEEAANSDSKTVNSDLDDDDDGPDTDVEVDEFPDIEFDENEMKPDINDDENKLQIKSGDSLQSSLWINPNEREIEDLKKYFIYFKEFGSYNKQIKLVKSRSNSRGSILEDFLVSQQQHTQGQVQTVNRIGPSYLNLSLTAVLGNTDYDNLMTSPTPSFLQGQSCYPQKVHESTSTTSCSSLKIHKDISKYSSFASIYSTISSRVKSVVPFVKVAYPDMMGGQGSNQPEPLNKMERSACRTKLLSCVDRAINPEAYMNEIVYDLDQICSSLNPETAIQRSSDNVLSVLTNTDEQEITKLNNFSSRLNFESRFESGNLRKAIQIGPREYELILMPDVNSTKRHQWFYFEVRNMQAGRSYTFNIVNCEKSDSQFNFGMKPVLYSVREATNGRAGWIRAGSDICYYRNSYHYANQKNHNKCYLTVTFNIEFPHTNDVCYIAYHFPYTYSMMMAKILQWSLQMPAGVYLRAEPLCYSLNSNEIPLLTISSEDNTTSPIADREIVFLTARVHPGESNASWVMDGTLGFLLGDTAAAAALRTKYVFKIVPMLNVEGVINGCHRCGLTNEDLNRRWCKPNPVLHPSIYHTKGLIEYLVRVWKKPPLVYCDYHGHSRKKNVFFYGCAAAESWCSNDRLLQDEPVKYLMLPALMHRISPAFALGSCSFRVERERESTARVTVWRHLGVTRSYTMEASFCGFDRGPFKGFHLNTQHLQSVGSDFCEALNGLNDTATNVDIQLTKDLNGNIVEISLNGAGVNREIAVDSEPGSGSDSVLKTDSDEDFD